MKLQDHQVLQRGGLHAPGRPAGFELRDASGSRIDLLYKTTLEGDTAIPHITDGHGPIPQGMHLRNASKECICGMAGGLNPTAMSSTRAIWRFPPSAPSQFLTTGRIFIEDL